MTLAMRVYCQVLLSSDNLKMMMDDVTIGRGDYISGDYGPPAVNLRTFLLIMEHSAW